MKATNLILFWLISISVISAAQARNTTKEEGANEFRKEAREQRSFNFANYSKLRRGMSIQEVSVLLGRDGAAPVDQVFEGARLESRYWESTPYAILASFANGRLTSFVAMKNKTLVSQELWTK